MTLKEIRHKIDTLLKHGNKLIYIEDENLNLYQVIDIFIDDETHRIIIEASKM